MDDNIKREPFRKATPSENLRIIRARLDSTLSPAEQRELEEAATLIERLAGDRDSWEQQASDRVKDWDDMRKRAEAAEAEVANLREALREASNNMRKLMECEADQRDCEQCLAHIDALLRADIGNMMDEWRRANASPASDREDAERYRWLSEHTVATGLSRWMHETGRHQFLGAAIDAARKREGA